MADKQKVNNIISSLDYIPGQAISGALADYYINVLKKSPSSEEFVDLFLSNKTKFPDCNLENTRVLPLTAITCKNNPGFLWDDNFNNPHGSIDTLVPLINNDLTKKQYDDALFECQHNRDNCESLMDRFSGYYSKDKETTFQLKSPQKRLLTRNRLDEYTEASREIFSIEVLEEGQEFKGELDQTSFNILKETIGDCELWVGSAKTRGLGNIALTFDVRDNIIEFNDTDIFDRYIGLKNKLYKKPKIFSLTLHSDVICRDDILRFKSFLEIEDIIKCQNLSLLEIALLNKFKLAQFWSQTRVIMGWNNKLKLPKENQHGVAKGSVFFFVLNKDEEVEDEQLVKILDKIEHEGIGEGRNLGFGKIRVCDEFHWEVAIK